MYKPITSFPMVREIFGRVCSTSFANSINKSNDIARLNFLKALTILLKFTKQDKVRKPSRPFLKQFFIALIERRGSRTFAIAIDSRKTFGCGTETRS